MKFNICGKDVVRLTVLGIGYPKDGGGCMKSPALYYYRLSKIILEAIRLK